MGHSFPRPRSYITCHFPFTEMLAYKKNRAYNHFQQEAKRGTMNYLEPRVLYHICFSYQHKALFQGVSCFLSDSTFSQWPMSQYWLSLAPCLSGSLVCDEREAEANPARVTFYQCGLHLPHFTPKRRHSDLFSHLCLNVFTITLLLCYSSGQKT